MAKRYFPRYDWTYHAGNYVFHPVDRAAVMRELDGHIEDRIEAYIEAGLSHETALEKALAAMGDPEETGRALARLHKPWLGWLLTASKIWLAFCLLLTLVIPRQGSGKIRPLIGEPMERYVQYMEDAQADGYIIEPISGGGSFSRGGYTVRVRRTFLAHRDEEHRLLVEVVWTSDHYRNDIGHAFEKAVITDASGAVLSDDSDSISYGARQTNQYFWFDLPPNIHGTLYLQYAFGGLHESAVIGAV